MTGPKAICQYAHCDRPGRIISAHENAIYRVKGYAEERDAGGAHSILNREPVGQERWHRDCWHNWQRELRLAGQEPLL